MTLSSWNNTQTKQTILVLNYRVQYGRVQQEKEQQMDGLTVDE
jgi:hypothetical protein